MPSTTAEPAPAPRTAPSPESAPVPSTLQERRLPSSFESDADFYNERPFLKIVRRLREEPLIPLGCALTVIAFSGAWMAMRKGDHHRVQRMFRARVAAQGFTVAAMLGGSYYYSEDRRRTEDLWKVKRDEEHEQKRTRWLRELEARDEEEKEIRAQLERKKARAAERAAATVEKKGERGEAAAEKLVKEAGADGSGSDKPGQSAILSSLSSWRGGQKKQTDDKEVEDTAGKADASETRSRTKESPEKGT